MNELSEQEKIRIGTSIAKLFMLRKDTVHKDRYKTLWGNKTALGVYYTFERVMEDIETNDFKIDGELFT